MNIHSTSRKILITLLFAGSILAAKPQAHLTTVIPADVIAGGSSISISGGQLGSISFNLATILPSAKIDSCKLQLVIFKNSGQKMVLDVKYQGNAPAGLRNNRINYVSIDSTNVANSIVSLNVNPLFLQAPSPGLLPVTLQAPAGNTATIYSPQNPLATGAAPGNAPRLVVYYTLQPGPNQADWGTSRYNAQHTAESWTRLMGQPAASYMPRQIADLTAVQNGLLVYKKLVYAVGQGTGGTAIFAIDPITLDKNVVADALPDAVTTPVIDNSGRLYYVSANNIAVINLANSNNRTKPDPIAISPIKTIDNSPVTGADGSLYLAADDIIYAYSPYPRHQLIWQYSLAGRKSPVTLSNNGAVAYVVSCASNQIIALNTLNGRQLYQPAKITINDNDPNIGTPVPLVDSAGNVYVTNKLAGANTMYIFDAALRLKKTISGTNISSPACGPDSSVYFVQDGNLIKSYSTRQIIVKAITSKQSVVRGLISDASYNVYGMASDTLVAYNKTTNTVTAAKTGLSFQKPLVMAPDGALYSATSSSLIAIRPNKYTGDYTVTINDGIYNNVSFTGNTVVVPVNYTLSNKKILVGKTAVTFAKNVTLNNANILVETGGTITFQNGFAVKQGSTLECKTGF